MSEMPVGPMPNYQRNLRERIAEKLTEALALAGATG